VNSKRGVPLRKVNYRPCGARAPSRIKASKPRSPAVAVRIRPGERQTNNGKGAERSDEERSLRGEGNPLNEQDPGRGCGMKQARGAGARRKPSRGCEHLRTERIEALETLEMSGRTRSCREEGRDPGSEA